MEKNGLGLRTKSRFGPEVRGRVWHILTMSPDEFRHFTAQSEDEIGAFTLKSEVENTENRKNPRKWASKWPEQAGNRRKLLGDPHRVTLDPFPPKISCIVASVVRGRTSPKLGYVPGRTQPLSG